MYVLLSLNILWQQRRRFGLRNITRLMLKLVLEGSIENYDFQHRFGLKGHANDMPDAAFVL